MKSLLVVFICAAVVCIVSSVEFDKEVGKACLDKYGISVEEIINYNNGGSQPKKIGCSVGCAIRNSEADKSEMLDLTVEEFGKDLSVAKRQDLKTCLKNIEYSEDECVFGQQIVTCSDDAYATN